LTKKIVLISCASKKKPVPCKARDLYDSPLFRLSIQYARKLEPDIVFILSAKYGLITTDEVIGPYDVTLNDMIASQRRMWASRVIQELQKRTDLQRDHFTILAGERYRHHLLPHLMCYDLPLEGLGIGKQLQYLKRVCNE
jgi:hypothetical protein